METKTKLAAKGSVLDRREISKAFFGAFVDKEIAYRMPHALGLVTFGDRVTVELEITREFESFAAVFGDISKLQPATHLLDAVVQACTLIRSYCQVGRAPHLSRSVFLFVNPRTQRLMLPSSLPSASAAFCACRTAKVHQLLMVGVFFWLTFVSIRLGLEGDGRVGAACTSGSAVRV